MSEDAEVGWEVGEHGARFASFHVEDKLLVHLIGVHGLEGTEELISIEIVINDGNETSTSVISEVNENVVFGSALKDFLSASGLGVTGEDSKEVLGVDISTLVVNNTAFVDVFTVWLVENFSWVWVF